MLAPHKSSHLARRLVMTLETFKITSSKFYNYKSAKKKKNMVEFQGVLPTILQMSLLQWLSGEGKCVWYCEWLLAKLETR